VRRTEAVISFGFHAAGIQVLDRTPEHSLSLPTRGHVRSPYCDERSGGTKQEGSTRQTWHLVNANPLKVCAPARSSPGLPDRCAFRILVRSEMIDVFVALGQRAFDGVPCPSWRFWLRFDLCSGLARSSKPSGSD
jgi:hypothetical protein